MYKTKTYDELTFADDYLFCRIMQDETICKGLIKTLLGIDADRIEYLNQQQTISPDYDAHGIRMDVFVKGTNEIYDLEMQTRHFDELPKRARYYQSLVDLDTLDRNQDYRQLKESFIIFICTADPFGFSLPCYTVEQVCKEEPKASEKINDKTHKIYYNATSWQKSENAEIRGFLKYLTTQSADTDFTKALQSAVRKSRKNELWRKQFMTLQEMLNDVKAYGREEGIAIGEERGRIETARNMIFDDLSFETISKYTGLSIEAIQEIADETEAEKQPS